jgi:hypothetical protein
MRRSYSSELKMYINRRKTDMRILPIGPIIPIIPISPIKRRKQQKAESKKIPRIISDVNLGKNIDITIEAVPKLQFWNSNLKISSFARLKA